MLNPPLLCPPPVRATGNACAFCEAHGIGKPGHVYVVWRRDYDAWHYGAPEPPAAA